MKKIYCLLFILFLLFASPIHAQSLSLGIEQGTQGLFNHQIPLDFSMTPNVTITKATVNWILPEGMKIIKDEATTYQTPLVSGETMYDHLVIVPQFAGTYQISANVSGVYQGAVFSTTKTIPIVIDQSLHAIDATENFSVRQSVYIALSIVFMILFFILLKDVYTSFRQKFFTWLNKEG